MNGENEKNSIRGLVALHSGGHPLFAACEKYSIVGKCTLRDETKKLVEFDGADVFFTLKDDGKWASPFRVMGYKRGAVAYDRVLIQKGQTEILLFEVFHQLAPQALQGLGRDAVRAHAGEVERGLELPRTRGILRPIGGNFETKCRGF